jgi:hypothetical protein
MEESGSFHRKGLVSGGIGLEMILSTQLGLGVMLAGVMLGLPVFLNVILLVGAITGVLYVCSAEIHYTVETTGLTRSIQPKVLKSSRLFRHEHIGWERILWYTVDYDRSRSWKAYPYLLIRGKNPAFQWRIAGRDLQDTAFQQFVKAFTQGIPYINPAPSDEAHRKSRPQPAGPSIASTPPAMPRIRPRQGFYRTKRAKGLAILFLAADILLIGGVLTGSISLSATSTFRLIGVLIPGTAYVLYRTFRK